MVPELKIYKNFKKSIFFYYVIVKMLTVLLGDIIFQVLKKKYWMYLGIIQKITFFRSCERDHKLSMSLNTHLQFHYKSLHHNRERVLICPFYINCLLLAGKNNIIFFLTFKQNI